MQRVCYQKVTKIRHTIFVNFKPHKIEKYFIALVLSCRGSVTVWNEFAVKYQFDVTDVVVG